MHFKPCRCIGAIVLAAPLLVRAAPAEWPEFRGPTGDGLVAANGLPLTWSETNHVAWKTEIPHRGWSTPVIQGRQIWMTTATLAGNDFFAVCVDAETGKVLFNELLFHCDSPEPLGNNVNCYASPSPAIEPGRVYAHFGSYGTACLDTETGKPVWKRDDLPCRHFRGPGSSVVLFEDLLILTMDGVDVQYLAALDTKTGKTVWKTDRTAEWNDMDENRKPRMEGDFRKAYSTPLIVKVGDGFQLFSPGAKAVYGYDPRNGRELWKVGHTCFSAAARPVFGEGLAIMATGIPKSHLLAIRPEGHGEVAWQYDEAVPRTPSPIIAGDLLYMVSDDGQLTCLEVATGKKLWREPIGGSYCASPILADGRLYFSNTLGKTTVIKAGRTFEVLAVNTLPDGFMASPAVLGKSLILRTKTHLYRIE